VQSSGKTPPPNARQINGCVSFSCWRASRTNPKDRHGNRQAQGMSARFDNTDGRMRGRRLQERRLKKWTEAVGCCAKCGRLTEFSARPA
jgi:hypothetical protein